MRKYDRAVCRSFHHSPSPPVQYKQGKEDQEYYEIKSLQVLLRPLLFFFNDLPTPPSISIQFVCVCRLCSSCLFRSTSNSLRQDDPFDWRRHLSVTLPIPPFQHFARRTGTGTTFPIGNPILSYPISTARVIFLAFVLVHLEESLDMYGKGKYNDDTHVRAHCVNRGQIK